ncbi:MAG: YdeI/OmpD-associated family protein [Cytophagales bacterium]
MVIKNVILEKFGSKGEKSGWVYVFIDSETSEQINSGVKKAYRVKGQIDEIEFNQIALAPMGDGDFILPIKKDLFKKLHKNIGAQVVLSLELDNTEFKPDTDLIEALENEVDVFQKFNLLTQGHQRYFSNWIAQAKSMDTKSKRIYQTIFALKNGLNYSEMIKYFKEHKDSIF